VENKTLIVALGCTDGIVIGTDSASSDTSSGTKQPVLKIHQIGNLPIVGGGSGDGGLIQKIHEKLEDEAPKLMGTKFIKTRRNIQLAVRHEQKEAKEVHLPQQPPFDNPPTATFLFACIQNHTPFVLEIEVDARDTVYDKNYGSFTAIGSGKGLAQVAMRSHLHTERNLEAGKVIAYRVLEDSIDLAAAYLSKPIHLYTIDLDENVKKLSDEEMNAVSAACELWRQHERESLGKALAPATAAEVTTAPIPEPAEDVADKPA
jgi:proteasome beta subunit